MYKQLWRPLLFSLEPEVAHERTMLLCESLQKLPGMPRLITALVRNHNAPQLQQTIWGLDFPSPIGVAAGLDKNCRIVPFLSYLGASFIEVGSVTNIPSSGNPPPRLFRLLKDEALINRMGLNNDGPDKILQRLAELPPLPLCRVGLNIAKTNNPQLIGDEAVSDIVSCFERVQVSGAFLVLNVSCPNTEDGRTFESGSGLSQLLREVISRRHTSAPLLIKLSIDLSNEAFHEAIATCERVAIDGYVLSNTTNSRQSLRTAPRALENIGRGGLSGPPLRDRAMERVRILRKLTTKPIIGVGGINSGAAAYQFIRSGASLVECYTGLVYEGPGLLAKMKHELKELLRRDGFSGISEAVGVDT